MVETTTKTQKPTTTMVETTTTTQKPNNPIITKLNIIDNKNYNSKIPKIDTIYNYNGTNNYDITYNYNY